MSPASGLLGVQAVPLREAYLIQLREHAIALIWFGYARMDAVTFSAAEEDNITGELVRHMNLALQRDDAGAPPWLDHYSVSEQVRSDASGKFGMSRPIVDIEFERVRRGMRPRLRFEARRLRRRADAFRYLGEEGLGAFLSGHYSRTHDEAGMLGYLQRGNESAWVAKLSAELHSRRSRYLVTPSGQWRRIFSPTCKRPAYQSEHTDSAGRTISILHVLLDFSGGARQAELL